MPTTRTHTWDGLPRATEPPYGCLVLVHRHLNWLAVTNYERLCESRWNVRDSAAQPKVYSWLGSVESGRLCS